MPFIRLSNYLGFASRVSLISVCLISACADDGFIREPDPCPEACWGEPDPGFWEPGVPSPEVEDDDREPEPYPESPCGTEAYVGPGNTCIPRQECGSAETGFLSFDITQDRICRPHPIGVGSQHSCALNANGALQCWGDHSEGQIVLPPAMVGFFDEPYRDVDTTLNGGCVVTRTGRAKCWGMLGSPVEEAARNARFTQLKIGGASCGLDENHSLFCWNGWGPLGDAALPIGAFADFDVSDEHGCALTFDGDLRCWGSNASGEAPIGGFAGGPFVDVATGIDVTCAVKETGGVSCFGQADDLRVIDLAGNYTQVAVGDLYACALNDLGSILCWGELNDFPLASPPEGTFLSVELGRDYVCGVEETKGVLCWGPNFLQQARRPRARILEAVPENASAVVRYEDGSADSNAGLHFEDDLVKVSARFTQRCGLHSDGSLSCWSEIGDTAPVPEGSFVDVSVGDSFSCGVLDDESLVCWGEAELIVPQGNFLEVQVGIGLSACALTTEGGVECFGDSAALVDEMPSGTGFTTLSVGRGGCVLDAAGTALCWGVDNMQFPTGPFSEITGDGANGCGINDDQRAECWGIFEGSPWEQRFEQVSCASEVCCGATLEGDAYCWGFRQLHLQAP